MIQTGQILNDTYEIRERLSSGGGGIIYKAYHRRMRKTVAIKLIKDGLKGDLHNRAEVDIMKDLKNDYLPQVLDFVEDGDDVYTVMEFIEGQNFKQIISSGKKFTEAQVRKYAVQLCEAVEYLHNHVPPIIHSDIKPANMMLTPRDNICLIDFNISLIADNGFVKAKGASENFSAPEQFMRLIKAPADIDEFHEETRFVSDDDDTEILLDEEIPSADVKTQNTGRAYIDVRTDIYGIGASVYYILTGRIPQNGRADFRGVRISSQMQSAIKKAMSPQPELRYESVTDLKKAFVSKINHKALFSCIAAAAGILAVGGIILFAMSSKQESDITEMSIESSAVSVTGAHSVPETTDKNTVSAETEAISAEWSLDRFYDEVLIAINAERSNAGDSPLQLDDKLCEGCREDFLNGTYRTASKSKSWYSIYDTANAYFELKFDLKAFPSEYESATSLLKYEEDNFSAKWQEEGFTHFGIYAVENDDGTYFVEWVIAYKKSITSTSKNKNETGTDIVPAVSDKRTENKQDRISETVPDYITIKGNTYSTSLRELDLQEMELDNDDIIPLKYMTELEVLWLNNNNISSIEPLKELKQLKELHLGHNRISDISPLKDLTRLERLGLKYNSISDIEDLSELVNLVSLTLSNNNVKNIDPIGEMTALERLWINDNAVANISPLKSCRKIIQLDIGNDPVSDISAISNMSNMHYLALYGTDITDISAIKDLSGIIKLDISNTNVKDISSVKDYKKLKTLGIYNIPAPDKQITNLKKQLSQCTIYDYKDYFDDMYAGLGY